MNSTVEEIATALRGHERFIILSHIRPDGDAIGSTIALGSMLEEMGKSVVYVNEDGVPESLAFLPDSEKVQKANGEVQDVEVAIAVDCANKPRLGEKALQMASAAKLWINIDHHKSNPGYGDLNLIDSSSPATGQILYDLITSQNLPFNSVTRDNIYVAVSTDTGSFQYRGTTAATYEMAADLVRRGADVARLNEQTYDSYPFRRVALIRELLNTLQLSEDGKVVDWQLTVEVKHKLGLKPDDSEGLIDMIRSIKEVRVALFFEELLDKMIRVSIRAKLGALDACELAQVFGGGGHALAAGIRMEGPIEVARKQVLTEVSNRLEK